MHLLRKHVRPSQVLLCSLLRQIWIFMVDSTKPRRLSIELDDYAASSTEHYLEILQEELARRLKPAALEIISIKEIKLDDKGS